MPDAGIRGGHARVLRAFKDAVSLSSHVLQHDPAQMPTDVYGRLRPRADAGLRGLLDERAARVTHPWLRPLNACMTQPQAGVIRVVRGFASGVAAVAAGTDGSVAVVVPAPVESVVHRREGAVVPTALRGDLAAVPEAWDPIVVDLRTGQRLTVLAGHGDDVNAVAVTPDGSRAITVCGRRAASVKWLRGQVAEPRPSRDNVVRVWSLPDGQLLETLEGHTAAVTCVGATTDGRYAVTGSDDTSVIVWDMDSGREAIRFEEHKGRVVAVAAMRLQSPDGRLDAVLSASSGEYLGWTLQTGEVFARLPLEVLYDEALGSAPGAPTVFALHETIGSFQPFTVRSTDLAGGERHRSSELSRPVAAFAISSAGDGALVALADDTSVRRWRLPAMAEEGQLTGHIADVTCACFTANDTQAVTGSMDGTIVLWDLEAAGGPGLQEAHAEDVNSLAVDRAGTVLVSGSYDRTVKASLTPALDETRLVGRHGRSVTSVAVSDDGATIVSGSLDGSARVWRGSAEEPVFTGDHGGEVQAVAISPSGETVYAGGADGLVRRWNLPRDADGTVVISHTAAIRALVYDGEDDQLLAGAEDGAVLIVDADRPPNVLVTHAEPVTALSLGPGSSFIVGDYAGAVASYGPLGTQLHETRAFGGAVWGVGVTADRALALAASDDGTLRVWRTHDWREIAAFAADTSLYSLAVGPHDDVFLGAGAQSGRLHALRLENGGRDREGASPRMRGKNHE